MLKSIASKIIQLIEIHYNAPEGITRYHIENGVEYDGVLRFYFFIPSKCEINGEALSCLFFAGKYLYFFH